MEQTSTSGMFHEVTNLFV